MAKAAVLIASFLFVALTMFCEETTADYEGCCVSYSKYQLPFIRIKGYSIQTPQDYCDIPAVVFHTIKGKHICANPKDTWVEIRIQQLMNKVKKMT
ncbi:C-C motif chemokine 20-like [Erpetoichthys calabaricus]|uniref:C-C motif chemokine 20-like n=1 Tax=Erpetoichthys calabaricus TaxID=27687 RepID=UPI00109FBF33|nr:C-C motif chemokine 20-like [Erpetoichthys calabaricus]